MKKRTILIPCLALLMLGSTMVGCSRHEHESEGNVIRKTTTTTTDRERPVTEERRTTTTTEKY